VEKALPGTSSIDQKVQRLVESNRKLRQQVEDSEKALYNNRRQRQRDDYNSTGSSSSNDDAAQSKSFNNKKYWMQRDRQNSAICQIAYLFKGRESRDYEFCLFLQLNS
jgi:hypothetical protein